MYRELLAEHPGAPIVYVSTGAWNTAPTLNRFLRSHGYPVGPLLLTDWGPTNTGWFRSGQEHKRASLDRLAKDFPTIRWLLVGDDGQHDPKIYQDFAEARPEIVDAIAIRQLTPTEQVLSHGLPVSNEELQPRNTRPPREVPVYYAPDGYGLLRTPASMVASARRGRRRAALAAAAPAHPLTPRMADWGRAGAARGPGARRLPRRAHGRPRRRRGRAGVVLACSRPSTRRRPRSRAGWSTAGRGTASSSTSTSTASTSCSTWPAPAGCAGRRRCPHTVMRPGKSPIALRVRLSDGAGFDLTEAGTKKSLAAYIVRDVGRGARHRPARPRPAGRRLRRGDLRAGCSRAAAPRSRACCATRSSSPASATPTPTRSSTWPSCRRSRSPARSSPRTSSASTPRCATRSRARSVAASGKPAAELKDAKRAGMRVHGRTGQPCPVCGDTVREVSFADSSLQYCADLPDRRQAARRPPDVPTAQVTSAGLAGFARMGCHVDAAERPGRLRLRPARRRRHGRRP